MGQSCFFKALLVSSLILLIFFSTALGRDLRTAKLSGVYSTAELFPSTEGIVRKTMELMDYEPAGSNTNWNGFVASPPPESPLS
ncbi:hypothetical protein AtNW77_Chr5g0099031 [Arabidopsis thaliana]|uniref:Transmembrane protein n=4 Tax=Arabidopsis TaxID=3701 RepID=Q56YM4_ARATH|nr:uncharacterized protein AT5G15265 [Arabidopsis thaliana]NP_001318566.1 uncharacterized protein AT5G15265 [Arabidopsis thaliana]KAG7602322.1 hypothetical protein ISN45_At05g014060 [Arabidopsis thaliana x Arabidopsis arenosa]KAG7609268.1 hypothetical protein ISN44_As05g014010 [Arabidopsis suecica]AED92140.1 transmembrane protein [Arabidopsis thaliana]ANM70631.1 transmembrane protein [Arabidopsis thaliana]OAO94994.1 hypothetical protein AXX17_AT5G14770 [Arabidopsis thaliana]|eukprot:NP_001078588.1 transmembrane protein [Arabidopsis thaliana]